MKIWGHTSLTLLLILNFGCGYFKGEHIDYENPGSVKSSDETEESSATGGDDTSKQEDGSDSLSCSDSALALFESQVQSAINQTCAGCHASGGQGASSIELASGEAEKNKPVLLGYMGSSVDKLVQKLGPGGGHGGGEQLGNPLTKEGLQLWFDKESECQ